MIFEIGSSIVMAGVAGYAYLKTNGPATNDAEKIQRIFANSGLTIKEAGKVKTIRLKRKRTFKGGAEYIFQLPLGMSSKVIQDNKHVLEDGLNIRHKFIELDPRDILKLKWDRTIIRQVKKLLAKKPGRKEIEIDFDGMLRIRVFNEPMANDIPWNESMLDPGSWSVVIGVDREGKLIKHDFDNDKHLLVAGATGYGKSVVLKLIVTSLILQQPVNAEMALIDLKGGSAFHRFKDCSQVKHFGRDPEKAVEILEKIKEQMDHDFNAVVDQGFEDAKEAGIHKRHFVIIDESADIADNSKAMEIITEIARKGRSAGYYLLFCTQYPTAQVIPSQTKRNIMARLCYPVDTTTASMVVLDEAGGESLPDLPGRGIYKKRLKTTIQTPYMKNKEIQTRIQPYINIKPREESNHEQGVDEGTKSGKNPIVFTKV